MSDISTELPLPELSAPASAFLRVTRLQHVPGYLPGMHQPALIVEFRMFAAASAPVQEAFMRSIDKVCGALPELKPFAEFERWPVLACVTRATLGLLQRAGWPLLDTAVVFQKRTTADRALLAIPSLQLSDKGVVFALQAVLELVEAVGTERLQSCETALVRALNLLKEHAPRGMNSLRFIEAAHAQDIPWKRLAGNIFQFGWGARARWLDSSFTDQTPSLAVAAARDKRAATGILRQAGVPVPVHARATTEAEALRIATRLGYPVVVKPADLDGGRGVSAYLETPAEVAKAFAAASALSKQVLVEKHFIGNDYRLQVFKGEVYWATRRVPAGVTGDGVQSVRTLVDSANTNPKRGPSGTLKPLVLDDEALTWLKRQGLDAEAVPAAGRVVRLRGAANVASGGTIEPVLPVAHPDNLALAARAANLLRLDVAGVDLLIPDIRRPWHETGAIICEVNAQPQMSPQLPAELLARLVTGKGRIPALVVVGGERNVAACKALFEGLGTQPGCGLAGRHGVWMAGRQVALPPLTSFQAGQCVLNDPSATLLALHLDDEDLLQSGSPVDRIDHLVLAGPLHKDGNADWPRTLALATWLSNMSRQVWLLDAAPQWQQASMALARTDVRALLEHVGRALVETPL